MRPPTRYVSNTLDNTLNPVWEIEKIGINQYLLHIYRDLLTLKKTDKSGVLILLQLYYALLNMRCTNPVK